ncbi:MAG: hypothetical protein GX829_09225 [Clostridium sp.]|nr:hypothetical protein [Clostridium sp.]
MKFEFEMDKIKKKGEDMVKKGEEMAKDVMPKVKDATSDFKDSVSSFVDKGTKEAKKLFEKKDDVKDDVVDFSKKTKSNVQSSLSDMTDSGDEKKGKGKIVAGVAVAAAAATAYAVYRRNKAKNEDLRMDYAEKLQRWSEVESAERENHDDELQKPIKVAPKKVYKLGSNALIGEDVIINVSKTGNGFAFNPDDEGEPIADMDIKKVIMDKTSAIKDKISSKMEEAKLQGKLGTMDAKDKYIEIKDMAEDRFDDLKTKVDEEITPNVKKKAEEFKEEAEDKFEELKNKANLDEKAEEVKEEVKGKKEDAKDKFQDLKNKVSSSTKEKAKDAAGAVEDAGDKIEKKTDTLEVKVKDLVDDDKIEKIKRNDMAIDDGSSEDIVDEPFGAEEFMDEDEEKGLMDKVKNMASEAKEKLMPDHNDGDKELVGYRIAIHNRGDEDYLFSPMQFQVYDTVKRSVKLKAEIEEGTTLGNVIVKPGETYQGKLYVQKHLGVKDGIVFFRDLSLDYAVLYLTDNDNPVESNPRMVLDEDYLYSDEEVLKEHVDYKRQ